MQEWLKDKKNLPIVATVGILVLIGAVVLMLFETGVLPPQHAPAPVAVGTGPPGPPMGSMPPSQMMPPGSGPRPPGMPAGAPSGMPGRPGAPAQVAAAAVPKVAAPLNPAKGPDPFKVPGYHPFQVTPQVKQALSDALRVRNAIPAVYIQTYTPPDQLITRGKNGPLVAPDLTPQVSTSMRMSGVITSDNSVKALLETNGVSTQVQPGDSVDGGKVISIQPDGLTLRTSDNRLVRVPLSGVSTSGAASNPSPYGGGYPPGGTPGVMQPGDNPDAPPQ